MDRPGGPLGPQVAAQQRGLMAGDEGRVQLVHVNGRERVKRVLGGGRQAEACAKGRPGQPAQSA